jgi:4-hydroxymandelate oxidase
LNIVGARVKTSFVNPTPEPDLGQFICLSDFEPVARERMDHAVFEYVAGGAGDEITLRRNETAFDQIFLMPRVLREVSQIETKVSLFGKEIPDPILLAPAAYQRLMHPQGELASLQGANTHGIPFVVSTNTTVRIEDLVAQATVPLWLQVYVQQDRASTENLIKRVDDAGFQALCVTVDTPVLGIRPRQLRARFAVPSDIEVPYQADVRSGLRRGTSDPGRHSAIVWKDIEWLRSLTKMRLLLKGVLNPDDAELAIKAGADGVVVSNHGARNLDTVPATIEVLPAIVQRIGHQAPVLFDGGIRRGTDVIKALARGADAVLLGRPYLYALAVGGAAGVARAIDLLKKEVRYSMALLGRASIGELDRSVEWERK